MIYLILLSFWTFQSTPPVWAETKGGEVNGNGKRISIHSARVGGDSGGKRFPFDIKHFNPLRPCGRRRNH